MSDIGCCGFNSNALGYSTFRLNPDLGVLQQSSPRAAVPISTAKPLNTVAPKSLGDPQVALKDTGIFDSGCSRHMTGNKSFLTNYQEYDGGFVAFAGSSKGGKISGKGTIRTGNLDFEDVYFVKELKFNLFSVSQMCDKKNSVFFIETECLILSPDFKLLDENQVMLKIPRKDNMYSFDLKNIVPSKGNLVRGLPSKIFENDHTCVACQKGKQHKATCKSKLVTSISQPLQILHMDLFGPTFIKSLMGKMYCLVITDDYSRFSWVFFLAKKDETSSILRNFITGIENQLNHRVKIIRSDNGTEFKNQDLNQFCNSKGIKRKYNNARTPQQNEVAERKNRTLIEAVRTMLADSLLPIPFWAEAVNTACYVQNRVLVTKPHNKTPYELLIGRPPIISFMRPFGCPVSIFNTLDHLGKFDENADEGVLVGYSISSKAFREYNHRTRKVEENLHVNFLENQPNITGNGPKWLFDIDSLTNTMNYHPISVGNKANVNAAVSSPHDDVAGKKIDQEPSNKEDHTLKDDVDDMLHQEKMATKHPDDARSQFEEECDAQLCKGMRTRTSSTNSFNTVRTPLNTASASRTSYPAGTSSEPQLMPIDGSFSIDINDYPDDPLMPELEDIAEIHSTGIFGSAYDDFPNTPIDDQSVGAEADFHNMEPSINVSPIPTTRIHSIYPKYQIIGDPKSAVQTRRMAEKSKAGLVSFINKQRRTNHKDFQNCLFACFLSQVEPKKVNQALDDVRWVEAMHEELLQFKLLNVWTLVDLPKGKKAISTKWVFKNKKDKRGIVVRNKARLVAQGHRQEEGIDYDEVFAPVARIEAIKLFLAYASYMDFTVYQMDVKSAFLYGTIEQKVEKALYGLHQAPRAWYETLSTHLLENGFRRGTIDKTLFIKKIKNDILLVQVYVDDIIFGSTKKSLSTEFEKLMHKRFQMSSMGELTFFLGLQIYDWYFDVFTSSRPDIMFAVCACSGFQVTPKVSHMHAVKRIFRYLKGKPTLGLWYPKDSPMDLIAYSDSDYAGESIDRKSTTGEAEYIAASHCCGQVLWLQNHLHDYGYNYMRTKIHIDNKSTISVIKNPVSHSKTNHIEIRFHFTRDSYEKKLIKMVKIHMDNNVADLLTKAFNVTRFEFLIASIALASLKETAIGKDFPNPFMAGSLPKTIKQSNDPPFSRGYTLGSGKDSLELMELMAHYTQIVCFVRKKNREICLELILLGITLSTVSVKLILPDKYYYCWMKLVLLGFTLLITEDSLRKHLKLEDTEGISLLSNEEIFEHLAHMGYVTNSESLAFFKGHFSPQWKFFIHTILHCMGSKKTAWDQFSSNIATTLICLATSRRFNFSKFIFEAMVKNLDIPHKFLLYPRFIQLLLNKQQMLLLPHTRTYPTPTLTSKLFSNTRRASKGYSGVMTPLFESMLVQSHDEEQHQSPSRITSTPSLSQQPTPLSPLPEPIQPTHEAEETASMPHDLPLHDVHSHGSAEGSVQQHDLMVLVTKLNDRIDEFKKDLQQTKKTYSTALTKLVLREEEVREKLSDESEVLVQEETPTDIIEEHGSGEKGEMEISTANIQVSTASPPKVSTVVPHVYTRRSAKDKGNTIMEEPATPKKVKKRTQVQLSMDEELARKMEEEERIRFNAEQKKESDLTQNRKQELCKKKKKKKD
ncbi:putative ribonuclease H-like domain-containing protein [Tanacetum coccineum]|uniref:Ribonuclease H-like domain-containing protein n=1 Tax=Tanacetum coccineum TaxID=301880 RepID=A0ABQ5DFT9_9ASTR